MDRSEIANMVAVRLDRVSVLRRNAEGGQVQLLDEVSFSARSGEITAVIGPSGGGKSTLIRLLNRLADPDSGSVSLDGSDIRGIDPLQLRRLVALVPQKAFMFEGTVLDNLQKAFEYRNEVPPEADNEDVRQALSLARLDRKMLPREARSLSGGEQQRVALARALLTRPRVLLLDEPTSALDRRTSDALAATLKEITRSQKLTVIVVTHDLRLTGRIADYCFYLEAGRILEQGRGTDMLARPESGELKRFLAEPLDREE